MNKCIVPVRFAFFCGTTESFSGTTCLFSGSVVFTCHAGSPPVQIPSLVFKILSLLLFFSISSGGHAVLLNPQVRRWYQCWCGVGAGVPLSFQQQRLWNVHMHLSSVRTRNEEDDKVAASVRDIRVI